MKKFSITDVVDGGFCIGCGACSAMSPEIDMRATDIGTFLPVLSDVSDAGLAAGEAVCPFSTTTPDETQLGQELFSNEGGAFDPRIGYFNKLGAGGVSNAADRELSSSGGLTNWILCRLLETGEVDGIIHVGETSSDGSGLLFSYSVSHSLDEMAARKKSKYYATHVADIFRGLRGNGKRYAFVGVPCFVTAARHVARADAVYGQQFVYFIGLVCGHLKSTRFAELMAWQLDVPPDDLENVDFRRKMSGLPAHQYHFAAQSRSTGQWNSAVASSLYGGDWGHAFFQLKACDYCDDIFAEAADIALGDAWIPRYEQDWLGTNVVVSRNRVIDRLLEEGHESSEIRWEDLPKEDLVLSQGGNFRHRHDGLSLRLADAIRRGEKVPVKRIAPGSVKLPFFRRRIVRLRQKTASTSHLAFARARAARNLDLFKAEMMPITDSVRQTYWMLKRLSVRYIAKSILRRVGLR